MLSKSTVISCTRGGDFRYPFEGEKRQELRRGHRTSQDPIGFEAGDSNLYRYAGNNSVNVTDPSGLEGVTCTDATEISVKATSEFGPAGGENGAYAWMVTWDVTPKADKDHGGWVIQHLKYKYRVDQGKEKDEGDYYEAWKVEKGTTNVERPKAPKDLTKAFLKQIDKTTKEVPKYNDIFWHASFGKTATTGTLVTNGEAFYFPDLELPGKFKRDNPDTPGAGNLRAIKTEGNEKLIKDLFDKDKHKYSNGLKRRLFAHWEEGGEVKFDEPEEKK